MLVNESLDVKLQAVVRCEVRGGCEVSQSGGKHVCERLELRETLFSCEFCATLDGGERSAKQMHHKGARERLGSQDRIIKRVLGGFLIRKSVSQTVSLSVS